MLEIQGFMKRWGASPIGQRRITCLMSTHLGSGAAALLACCVVGAEVERAVGCGARAERESQKSRGLSVGVEGTVEGWGVRGPIRK